ncbi:MAG: ATP-binding cassette domain-containing protein [Verrucomicrobia bacterium]|nr:ATP-binding cassette domain-containing protein [Verrucomicrobiota bacterium]
MQLLGRLGQDAFGEDGGGFLQGGLGRDLLGEIHAFVGENGAGKSTLLKIITGIYRPDAGELRLDGRRLDLHSPQDAFRLGIGIAHQEIHLIPEAGIAEKRPARSSAQTRAVAASGLACRARNRAAFSPGSRA